MCNVIHACLFYNVIAFQQQLMDTSSRIMENQINAKAIDDTHCINKAILLSGNSDVDHIREAVLNNLYGQSLLHLSISKSSACIF
jgi:hypothetical protein